MRCVPIPCRLPATNVTSSRPTDKSRDLALLQEDCQLGHPRVRLTRDQTFEIAPDGVQQLDLVDDVRKRDHRQDQQRHDRQQGVLGNSACQQQALIGSERLQRWQRKCPGMLQQQSCPVTGAEIASPQAAHAVRLIEPDFTRIGLASVLEIVWHLAPVLCQLCHHLLVQPHVHCGRVVHVATEVKLRGE